MYSCNHTFLCIQENFFIMVLIENGKLWRALHTFPYGREGEGAWISLDRTILLKTCKCRHITITPLLLANSDKTFTRLTEKRKTKRVQKSSLYDCINYVLGVSTVLSQLANSSLFTNIIPVLCYTANNLPFMCSQ
jgi:hypothetical protein